MRPNRYHDGDETLSNDAHAPQNAQREIQPVRQALKRIERLRAGATVQYDVSGPTVVSPLDGLIAIAGTVAFACGSDTATVLTLIADRLSADSKLTPAEAAHAVEVALLDSRSSRKAASTTPLSAAPTPFTAPTVPPRTAPPSAPSATPAGAKAQPTPRIRKRVLPRRSS